MVAGVLLLYSGVWARVSAKTRAQIQEGKEKQYHDGYQEETGSELDDDIQQDIGADVSLVGGVVQMTVYLPVFEDLLEIVGLKEFRDGFVILDVECIFQLFHPGSLLGDLGAVFLQIFHACQQAVGHIAAP